MTSKLEQLKAGTANGRLGRTSVSIKEVAEGLVAMCREGNFLGAIDRYYAQDVHSIEPSSTPHMPPELVGIELVKAKNHWWIQGYEVHHYSVRGPFVGEGQFVVHFAYNVTCRATGHRSTMTEMALYTVSADRIVREEFYYAP
jgi:SnoaL-like protein